jgi:carboxypeptidase T
LFPDQRGTNITNAAPENATGILISIHSYSKLVLWPWSHSANPPPNETGLSAIGEKLASYNGYFPKQGYYLYPTSGDTTDWAYGDWGLAAFTYEVGNQFFAPYDEIDAVQWPTNKPSLIYAAKIARTPYMTIKGPDITHLTLNPGENSNIVLSCIINDTKNGGQNSTGAVYYVNLPPWAPGSTGIPMNISSNAAPGPIISAEASINPDDYPDPETILFVQGIDSKGNQGAISAIFLNDVPEPTFPLAIIIFILFKKIR